MELQNENRNKTYVKRLCHRKICRAVGSPGPLRFRVPTALIWTMLLYLKATSVVVLQFKRKRLLYTNEKNKQNPKNISFEFKSWLENINSSKEFKQQDRFYGKILLVCCCCGRFFSQGRRKRMGSVGKIPPPPHCMLKWGFMRTFPRNQDVTAHFYKIIVFL